jgi:hypothetical protein
MEIKSIGDRTMSEESEDIDNQIRKGNEELEERRRENE